MREEYIREKRSVVSTWSGHHDLHSIQFDSEGVITLLKSISPRLQANNHISCMHTHTYRHACAHTHVHTMHTHTPMHTHAHTHVHTMHIHTPMHTHTCPYTHACTHMHAHPPMHAHTCMHTHPCMHTHACTHTPIHMHAHSRYFLVVFFLIHELVLCVR